MKLVWLAPDFEIEVARVTSENGHVVADVDPANLPESMREDVGVFEGYAPFALTAHDRIEVRA